MTPRDNQIALNRVNQLVKIAANDNHPRNRPPLLILIDAPLSSCLSRYTKAIAYSLNAWDSLVRFLDDGRLCLSNNAAERAVRGIAVGRRNGTFAGSDGGGRRAAAIYTLIETAKLNDVDPQAWLADSLP